MKKLVCLLSLALCMVLTTCTEATSIGVIGGPEFILVSEFGENGTDPEFLLYKKR